MRRFSQILCAGLLLVAANSFAQAGWQPTPVQQGTSPVSNVPSPPGMPGPGLPPGPNATGDLCKGNMIEGGAPYFLMAETSAQRQARLGTNEDPGCGPDPKKVYSRFGHEFTIEKYEREWAVYTGGHDAFQIRPFGFVNSYKELYQQNDKWVWVWQRVPDPANAQPLAEDLQKSTDTNNRYSDGDVNYLQSMRSEFFEVTPAKSTKAIRFEESSEGLPTSGSWRNGLAIADMNGDGFPDIIAPPERAGGSIPAIFLGDGKGHWKYWEQARWPHPLDYGTVAAGDFNKDGHMDLAFAVHLRGIFVMLGDGKGNFTEVSEGLPRDFPTRRLLVTDVDKDGYPDIVAISEGPTAVQNGEQTLGKVRVYYNREHGKKWEGVDVASPQMRVGGDYLSVANFSGGKYPDVVAGSIYQGSPDIIYLSNGPKQWSKLDSKVGTVIPFMSFYLASAAGKFTSKKTDDVILSYVRFWPPDLNEKMVPKPPLMEVTGLDRLSYRNGAPTRTPIARWGGKFGITGVAAADMDGDGKLDIVYTAFRDVNSREIGILVGDGKGGFARATTDGLTADRNVTYDLKIADVNGDGRPDVIIMYEADQVMAFSPRNGSIHVFLNRGPEPVAKVADRSSVNCRGPPEWRSAIRLASPIAAGTKIELPHDIDLLHFPRWFRCCSRSSFGYNAPQFALAFYVVTP